MALKKILVVSKNPDVLSLLGRGLGQDYEVSNTSIDEGVVAVVSEKKPDLIILDIVMPRKEEIVPGLHIRQLTEIPIIMLSIVGAEKDNVRILDPTKRDYLSKDHTMPMLKQHIQKVFST